MSWFNIPLHYNSSISTMRGLTPVIFSAATVASSFTTRPLYVWKWSTSPPFRILLMLSPTLLVYLMSARGHKTTLVIHVYQLGSAPPSSIFHFRSFKKKFRVWVMCSTGFLCPSTMKLGSRSGSANQGSPTLTSKSYVSRPQALMPALIFDRDLEVKL